MKRLVILAAVVVLAAGAAPSAQQGKGKGKGQASAQEYTLKWAMVTDYNNNATPDWSEQIRFDVWTAEDIEPHVQVVCFQDGDVVYGALWPITPVLTLSSRAWQSGPATCTARLYYIEGVKTHDVGSIQFNVGG
jgi:hypothetical protein